MLVNGTLEEKQVKSEFRSSSDVVEATAVVLGRNMVGSQGGEEEPFGYGRRRGLKPR